MKLDRFINRPVLSTVISILIVILGAIGLATLPITQYPDIAPPTVSVRATYTGASASTVLNSVIAPLEEQINGVENMMYMTSNASNTGAGDISIYFKQGTDPDMAAVNVQNRVSMAQGLLPAEVTKVGVTTQKRQTSMLVVFSLYDESDTYTEAFIENYAKINLIPQVQRVPGVGDASVMGQDYSMRIWLRPDVMAQYKLVPGDVSAALAEQNVEAAPGQFGERSNQTFQYTIRYKGRLQQPEEFENIVIKSLPDGEVLRLNDIAEIQLDRLGYNFTNRVNGHKAVTCIVYQMAGTNATQTISDIQALLDEASQSLPAGLKINVSMNANDFLFASIHEVLKTLIEAFILVFIVVYIFLQDLRSTLIPTIAIPVALIGTFFILSLVGFSLNLLTLCALVLAIAIVVDDAIVVVEGVHAKLDQGYTSARLASIDAMNELGGAIVSITLVMMAVFVPVSFMGGTAGTFYRQFGMTMAIAIGLSALNALTLSPALCAVLLKPHKQEGSEDIPPLKERMKTAYKTAHTTMINRYTEAIGKMLHPGITLTFTLVAILGKTFGYGLLDVVVHYGIRLTATRCSQYNGCSERIHDIYPTVPFLALIDKLRRQVYRILVLHQSCLLHKTLVGHIEDIFHKVMLEHTANPYSRHKQKDISDSYRNGIDNHIHNWRERQVEQPPVHKEEYKTSEEGRINLLPGHLLILDSLCTEARESQEYDGEDLCHKQVAEQPCRILKVEQYLIYHSDVDTHIHDSLIAEPVDMYYNKYNGYGTHKLHDLCQSSQIIFLLHNKFVLMVSEIGLRYAA